MEQYPPQNPPPPQPSGPNMNRSPGLGQKICPNCGSQNAEKVKFTWWSGVLGPKIYDIHRCKDCGTDFNGKTGQPITSGTIAIYTVVVLAIGIILCGGCYFVAAVMENM